MRPVRVDLEASLEIIDAKMIRAIGRAQLLVADLAHHNPNVFWELGVRHAWVSCGTLLISPTGSPRPPFDVNHVTVHEYARDASGVSDTDAVAAVRMLRPIVASTATTVDSPVFAALPGLAPQQIPPAPDPVGDEVVTAAAERISLAADLRRANDLLAEVAALDAQLGPTPASHALREQIGLALLDLDRPDDALPILAPLAGSDVGFDRPLLQQRYALALMHASGSDEQRASQLREAEARLSRLNDLYPGSGETLGLLGSAAKRMHEVAVITGPDPSGDRDRAIRYYEAGLAADPTDYYPGINAIALLRLRSRSASESGDADRARALIPVVRFMLDRPGRPDSVWRRATTAELLLHAHLLDGVPSVDECVRVYAHAAAGANPFELASMRKQLAYLAASGDPAEVIDRVLGALPDPA